jgi:aspartate ammonia-lyase
LLILSNATAFFSKSLILNIMTKKTRTEEDALGQIEVPADAYYGSFTTRALSNFQISDIKAPEFFRQALGMVKLAAAQANRELGSVKEKEAKAIEEAAQEFIDGKFNDEFTIDVFQAGAGTPYNMNANEIIANRANEILGAERGSYKYVHPNNQVNFAQSSNDVNPTAARIAVLMVFGTLKQEIAEFKKSLEAKGEEFMDVIKVGRTHLEDAVPVTMGQEFMAYAAAMKTALNTIEEAEKALTVIGLGGNATGSGINAHPEFQGLVTEKLSKISGLPLKPAPNLFETNNSHAAFLKASSALRALAVEVNRIANDLRILNMGPQAGIHEIKLPRVQPGSSIMPAKVNPSICECVNMICFQVIGNDQTISLGAQGGQLQLNWFTPLEMWNLLFSTKIMRNGLKMFREKSIDGIRAHRDQIKANFDCSMAMATALVPYLGYHEVAELVKEARKNKKTFYEVVAAKDLMSQEDLDELLSPKHMVKPGHIDEEILGRINSLRKPE